MNLSLSELRRRGVLGAVTAYAVVAAGGLQLADIVVHGMDLPPWTMRALIWIAALGLLATAVISWFFDLTRRGFVLTQAPPRSPRQISPGPATPAPATAPPQAALEKGATLANGRYRIERELGAGGMGRVLAAMDTRLGRRVAIKVVTGAHEPERVRRFEQEARMAGSLEHPNVLAVYDLGEEDGVPFLVTELLEGHTLRTVLAKGPLPPAQAHNLGLQLARGLAAAHGRGVVHRDLKPENVFVTEDGRLKILDFGLAKLVTPAEGDRALTVSGAIFGTPGYLSPEQARGEKAGPPSDVFSAGAILYEMLSGRRAFRGRSLIEAGHATLTAQPDPLPVSAPQGLAAVVSRALEKEPSRRFADGAGMARALESLGQGAPVAAAPRRRSTRSVLALATVAILAAFCSGVIVQRRSSRQRRAELERRTGLPPQPAVPGVSPIPPVPKPPVFDEKQFKQQLGEHLRAVLRQPEASLGVITGARAVANAGRPKQAEDMLRAQADRNPGDIRSHLELYALLRRSGRAEQAKNEAARYVRELDDEDWPAPLVRVYAGQESEDAALKTAGEADEDEKPSQLCQAYYYLALLRATGGDRAGARSLFQKALEQATRDVEAKFAAEELRALDRR